RAFDSVHGLARARAAAVSAYQAEGQLLLDPAHAADYEADFRAQAAPIFRVPGPSGPNVVEVARSGFTPEGSGGYLAKVIDADVSGASTSAARRALAALAAFLTDHDDLRVKVASGATAQAGDAFR